MKNFQPTSVTQIKRFIYLKEILFLAIGGFGGPGAHLNTIIRVFVKKRNFLSEQDLLELHSFCQMLPGPSTTQMITAIGYKMGGGLFAALSLIIWILPASLLMTGLVLGWSYIDTRSISLNSLRYIQPMAIGFIAAAAYKLFSLLSKNKLSIALYFLGAIGASLIGSPWVFPILLFTGGLISRLANRDEFPPYHPKLKPKWSIFFVFAGLFLFSVIVGNITQNKSVLLFENSFQYGSIVFGGGNVLIPMMFKQYVSFKEYLSANDFLLGVGFLQATPGPVFSISTYANGLALAEGGWVAQLWGCLIGTVGIFLPGILMIFFLFPLWDEMKQMPLFRKSIDGVTAVSAGLVLAAAYLMFMEIDYSSSANLICISATAALVILTKVPPPVIVLMTIIAGAIIPA